MSMEQQAIFILPTEAYKLKFYNDRLDEITQFVLLTNIEP
jgi:hypothetical protein